MSLGILNAAQSQSEATFVPGLLPRARAEVASAAQLETDGLFVSSLFGRGCQNHFGIPFWLVGEFTTHFSTYFGGDWLMFTGGTGC